MYHQVSRHDTIRVSIHIPRRHTDNRRPNAISQIHGIQHKNIIFLHFLKFHLYLITYMNHQNVYITLTHIYMYDQTHKHANKRTKL